jgi:hypothetical protein
MKHLSEEELIEVYYGEGGAPAVAHLAGCRECSAQFAELQRDLEGARMAAVPERGAEYGERVWEALRPRLIPYEKKALGWRGFFGKSWVQWRAVVLAVGCAALVAAAFVGGRYWERHNSGTTNVVGNAGPQAKQRVVLVVLTDHLDRTERLLVALEHADSSDHAENAQMQSEARELLASNRLYRTTATNAGDPALAGALDRLEGVLAEVANDPNLTVADLQRVRDEMNTEGILFEVRVLLARTPDQGSGLKPAKGASI